MRRNLLFIAAVAMWVPRSAFAQDWDGFYAGANVSLGEMTSFRTDGNPASGRLVPDKGFGLFGGYNRQLESGLVLGAEFSFSSVGPFYDVVIVPTSLAMTNLVEARARIGYAAGDFLPYAAAGFVSGLSEFDDTINQRSARENGRVVGFGLEYRASDRVSLRLEYEVQSFHNLKNGACGSHQDCDTKISVLSVGAAWHF